MNKTKIEWVKNPDGSQGFSCNPFSGLCPVGCWYCWGKGFVKRFEDERVMFWEHRLEKIRKRKKAAGIFMCSKFELFHSCTAKLILPENTKFDNASWRDLVFQAIESCPQHRFYILTKFPQNIDRPMPDNVWLGVSVTEDKDIWRIKELIEIPARIKFVSIEPFLKPIYCLASEFLQQMNWIIIGRLTQYGKKHDPKYEWIKGFEVFAKNRNIPIFLKENLKEIWGEPLIQEMPE